MVINNKKICFNNESGFSFVELVVAIFIFLVGIIGVYMVISYQITDIRKVNQRLTALYLGQEAIEIVKNVRDGNLIGKIAWDSGLSAGCYRVSHDDAALISESCGSCNDDNFSILKMDAGGYYNHSTGNNTNFRRQIKIENFTEGGFPYKKITVTMCWKDGLNKYSAVVIDHLYGYWNP